MRRIGAARNERKSWPSSQYRRPDLLTVCLQKTLTMAANGGRSRTLISRYRRSAACFWTSADCRGPRLADL